MRVALRKSIEFNTNAEGPSGLAPLTLLAVGVPLGIWNAFSLYGGGSQLVAFEAAAGWFVLLAIGYLLLHGLKGLAWCSVPVLLTFRALVELVGVPALRFGSGVDMLNSVYIHAMLLSLIGFIAFWIGSLVLMRQGGFRFVPQARNTSGRIVFLSAAMLILGVVGKFILWKAGLFSYTADSALRESNFAIMQWLGFLANLLNAALVVSAIEVFGKRAAEPLLRIVFYLAIVFSIGFGAISGMKEGAITPLLYILLAYGITKGRVPRMVFLLPLSLIFIYPFVNAYRVNLNSGYRDQVNSIAGLGDTLHKTFDDVVEASGSLGETVGDSVDNATHRLSALTFVHDVVGLPDPSLLNGDEKVWLAPVYPLVPRFLWKDKPVLNKGQRLSVAMGSTATSSAAVTPIGDLYSLYGTYGVAVGMLLWGASLQLYMNWIGRGSLSEKGLFIYILMLLPLINLEEDVVALVAAAVQTIIVTMLMSWMIYGHPVSVIRVARAPRSIGGL
jgi:hypothetical protein